MIAGLTRGTRRGPLPLLPSGPGGVHGLPLRGTRLSYPPANAELTKTISMSTYGTVATNSMSHSPETASFGFFSHAKIKWRRERDSNPRYAINVHTLSRRAPSTARTSLRKRKGNIVYAELFVQHFVKMDVDAITEK